MTTIVLMLYSVICILTVLKIDRHVFNKKHLLLIAEITGFAAIAAAIVLNYINNGLNYIVGILIIIFFAMQTWSRNIANKNCK